MASSNIHGGWLIDKALLSLGKRFSRPCDMDHTEAAKELLSSAQVCFGVREVHIGGHRSCAITFFCILFGGGISASECAFVNTNEHDPKQVTIPTTGKEAASVSSGLTARPRTFG